MGRGINSNLIVGGALGLGAIYIFSKLPKGFARPSEARQEYRANKFEEKLQTHDARHDKKQARHERRQNIYEEKQELDEIKFNSKQEKAQDNADYKDMRRNNRNERRRARQEGRTSRVKARISKREKTGKTATGRMISSGASKLKRAIRSHRATKKKIRSSISSKVKKFFRKRDKRKRGRRR